MRIAALLPLLALCLPTPAAAQSSSGSVGELMDAAAARYASIDGLCATFEQTLEVVLLGQRVESRGTVCQMDPGYFRMRFSDPDGDLIVADGEFLWLYTPSSHPGQVVRTAMAGALRTVDFQREFLEDPSMKYRMEDLGTDPERPDLRGVRLTPRASSPYRSAEVWVDPEDALVHRIRIEQTNGSVRTVALHDLVVDPPQDPADYRFTPPPGVTVVTR